MAWPIWSARHADHANSPLGNMAIQLVIILVIVGVLALVFWTSSYGDASQSGN